MAHKALVQRTVQPKEIEAACFAIAAEDRLIAAGGGQSGGTKSLSYNPHTGKFTIQFNDETPSVVSTFHDAATRYNEL
jgi:hypothetical protein